MDKLSNQIVLCCITFFDEDSKVSPSIASKVHRYFEEILALVTNNFSDISLLSKIKMCAESRDQSLQKDIAHTVKRKLDSDFELKQRILVKIKLLSEYGRILPHQGENSRINSTIPLDDQIELLLDKLNTLQSAKMVVSDVKIKVVLSFRIDNTYRIRNLLSCILNIHRQSISKKHIYLVAVCQDSDDSYREIISPFVDEYHFLHNDGDFNYAKGRNLGVTKSSNIESPLICFWDVDIITSSHAVKSIIDANWSKVGCVLPYDKLLNLDEESTCAHVLNLVNERNTTDFDYYSGQIMYEIYGGIIAVKSSLFDSIGGQDERFVGWGDEDNNFYFRAYQKSDVLRVSQSMFHYNHPRPNMTSKNKDLNRNLLKSLEDL